MLLLKQSKEVKAFIRMDFHKEDDDIIRSSRSQMFLKIDST